METTLTKPAIMTASARVDLQVTTRRRHEFQWADVHFAGHNPQASLGFEVIEELRKVGITSFELAVVWGLLLTSMAVLSLPPGPSLVLVVLADQLGRSVGDMYAGAIGPSIIQIALFCIWVVIARTLRNLEAPGRPVLLKPKRKQRGRLWRWPL